MKVIILGDGLLATEIQKQTKWKNVCRKKDEVNFNDEQTYFKYLNDYDVILNCIANTDTYSKDKESMWNTNFCGSEMIESGSPDRKILESILI